MDFIGLTSAWTSLGLHCLSSSSPEYCFLWGTDARKARLLTWVEMYFPNILIQKICTLNTVYRQWVIPINSEFTGTCKPTHNSTAFSSLADGWGQSMYLFGSTVLGQLALGAECFLGGKVPCSCYISDQQIGLPHAVMFFLGGWAIGFWPIKQQRL